jgi:hypothetical protein
MALWSSYCLALFSSPLVLFWAIITPKKLSTSFYWFWSCDWKVFPVTRLLINIISYVCMYV